MAKFAIGESRVMVMRSGCRSRRWVLSRRRSATLAQPRASQKWQRSALLRGQICAHRKYLVFTTPSLSRCAVICQDNAFILPCGYQVRCCIKSISLPMNPLTISHIEPPEKSVTLISRKICSPTRYLSIICMAMGCRRLCR